MIEEELIKKLKLLENKINDLERREHNHPIINLGTPTELTIAAGVVTRTRSAHIIDTEGDSASDDLDTINGGVDGDILILSATHSDRTVVCKDMTGNLQLVGNFTLDNGGDRIMLIYRNGLWFELSRSDVSL